MPTPPDFSVGQVLTAAHMDAVGLWLVKKQAIGTAVTSQTVTSAFSADFRNYRVIMTGCQPTATDSFRLMMGSGATTGHYGSMYYDRFDGAVTGTLRVNNGPSVYAVLNESGNKTAQFSCDILSPQAAEPTAITGGGYGRGFWCSWGGGVTASTQYTSFTITIDGAGTMTGGTIYVYGYNSN